MAQSEQSLSRKSKSCFIQVDLLQVNPCNNFSPEYNLNHSRISTNPKHNDSLLPLIE